MVAPRLCPERRQWAAMLDGHVSADEEARLGEHLDDCASCQRIVERLTQADGEWVRAVGPLGANPPDPPLRRAMDELKAEATAAEAAPWGAEVSLDFLSPSDEPGRLGRLGPYEVVKVLGRGGMGVVLKALDPSLNRYVAIKVLAPQWAGSAAARRRFAREGRAAAAIRHENVVAVHGVDEVKGLPYLVMEYVHGASLEERLERTGPPELRDVLRIGIQAADGLAAAHRQGLVHRDIKPANILLENGVARVKLTDFGLARAIDDASLTQSGMIAGTPLYMAPEQAAGASVDHRADLFSLGSVLYLLCTGRPAFRAPSTLAVLKRVCEATPRPIPDLNPEIPLWLVEIIAVLHAKDPADRFQSAEELSRLLSDHLAHMQDPRRVPQPAPARRAPAAGPSQPWSTAAVVVLVAGMFCVLTLCLCLTPFLFLWAIMPPMPPMPAMPAANALPAMQPEKAWHAVLDNPKVLRDADGDLHFSVAYQIDPAPRDATLKYHWVVRAGEWKLHERTLTQDEMGVRGTLDGHGKPPPIVAAVEAPLETYLEIEHLLPGKLGLQRERISEVLPLRP